MQRNVAEPRLLGDETKTNELGSENEIQIRLLL